VGYSFGEEIANAVTHGIGWLLSTAGLGLIVTLAALTGGATRVVSVAVYAATLVLLYAASTLYHALPCRRAKRVFQVLDHSAIYVLIAGTYTPITLVCLPKTWGWGLFGVVWSMAVIGVLLNVLPFRGSRGLSVVLYVVMGWAVVVAAKPLVATLDTLPLVLLVVGGLAYTIGLFFYAFRRIPYGHMVWHLFVLAGSVVHFLAIVHAVAL
jgi:hemolysin III